MPLVSVNSAIRVRDEPEAIIFWMAADNRRVRVFVTFEALHYGLNGYSVGPLQLAYAQEVFERQRTKIEAAASRKFDAEGVKGELDGAPALFVTAQDL